jgi:hypothetical protein
MDESLAAAPQNLVIILNLKTEPIARVADAIRTDLDKVAKYGSKFGRLVTLGIGESQFLVDYNKSQFKFDDQNWKEFKLPWNTPSEVLQARLSSYLVETAREMGEGKRERDMLLRGGSLALETFASRLNEEGPIGSLAALSIEDIMARAVEHVVTEFQERLETDHTLWRTMLDAWHGLLRLVVDFVYGKEYTTNLRRDRLDRAMPAFNIGGVAIGLGSLIVAILLLA